MSNSKKNRGKRSGRKDGGKLTTKQLQKQVLHLFRSNPNKRYTPKQIIQQLQLKNNKDAVRYAILKLQEDGRLKTVPTLKLRPEDDTSKSSRGKRKRSDAEAVKRNVVDYQGEDSASPHKRGTNKSAATTRPGQDRNTGFGESHKGSKNSGRQNGRTSEPLNSRTAPDELIGTVDLSRSGSGYIVVEGREQDIFIPQRRLAGAMNGDKVRIRFWMPRGRNKPEGEVVEVVDRKVEHFMGTYRDGRKYGIVIPDRVEYEFDIAVMPGNHDDAKDGDKVVVRVTDWPERAGQNPRGNITQVLGATGGTDIEMKGILINQGFELKHSEAAMEESEAIPETISPQEAHRRLDLRDVLTFTIDPHDAKDFDDAISYRRLDNGRLEIGVHIADVSHYVRPDSALDQEAARSTTSVYLVDRVLPMLPEKLSNGVCSLRPNEDKCTFSAMFEFDDRDIVRRTYFSKTLTHSDRRFTYEGAQELIEADPEGKHDVSKLERTGEEVDWTELMQHVDSIAKKLRARRFRNGSIDFNSEEVRFRLDEQGKPIDAFVKTSRDANKLIEDFMLLANRSVATFIANKGKKQEIPFPYRVHDEPDPEKMANLATFAAKFGVELDLSSPKAISKSYNRLRKLANERPELQVLSPLAIRTMAKAEYTTDNIGHYGLGFENYAHFTSPIRRYADVLVHRILEKNLGRAEYRVEKAHLEDHCKHISERERAAVKAERESTSYFQVLYIKDHLGEEFEGTVNGVIERGIFVQLDANYCEGFVPFETMSDRYDLGPARLIATGRRSGRKLQMGSAVRVQIVSADLDTRRIEMALIEETKEDKPSGRSTASAKTRSSRRTPRAKAAVGAEGAAETAQKVASAKTRRKRPSKASGGAAGVTKATSDASAKPAAKAPAKRRAPSRRRKKPE